MKQHARKLLKHPLIYGSSILVVGNLLANFFNFLFTVYMSRSLTPANYGTLATIIAFISFPSLVATAIGPLVMRYAGEFYAKNEQDKVRGLYIMIAKIFVSVGILICAIAFFNISQIGAFLHINNLTILYMTVVIAFVLFINVINVSFMQAKLAFSYQVLVSLTNSVSKFMLGVILIILGLSITGSVLSILIGSILAYAIGFIPLRFLFKTHVTKPNIHPKELLSYGIPAAFTLFGLTSFISSDIILVKHFFNPAMAGAYAGLSLVSRVIFYISSPISSVMFPIIVQKRAKKENFTNTFKIALLLVLVPSICVTLFYSQFSNFSILFFLKKHEYLVVAPLLLRFSIFISLYCLLTVIANFYLSIKKSFVSVFVISGAILQVILIYLFHSNFAQIITISTTITFLLVGMLLLYYPYATKKQLQT